MDLISHAQTGGREAFGVVDAPNDIAYSIYSNLPRETIKALAEELILVK